MTRQRLVRRRRTGTRDRTICAHHSRLLPRSTPPALSTRREQNDIQTINPRRHADRALAAEYLCEPREWTGSVSPAPRRQPIQQVNARITESTITMLAAGTPAKEVMMGGPARGVVARATTADRPLRRTSPTTAACSMDSRGNDRHAPHPAGTHGAPRTSRNLWGDGSR